MMRRFQIIVEGDVLDKQRLKKLIKDANRSFESIQHCN